MRIYVACLADYNAGILHGAWIDCEHKTASEIWQETAEMLRKSTYRNVWRAKCAECGHIQDFAGLPSEYECNECLSEAEPERFTSAEEWAIHDHEGFGNLIGEYTSFDRIAELAEYLADARTDDEQEMRLLAVRYLVEYAGETLTSAIGKAPNIYLHDQSPEDYAYGYFEDNIASVDSLPELIRCHIDWEGVARDMELNGCFSQFEGYLVEDQS